jgi:phosphatidylinositol alpha-1,6-mannosyltransferase
MQAPQLAALLRDCDIIHSTVEPYAPLARLVAGRRPCCITAHGSFVRSLPQRRWPGGWLYRQSLRHSHLVCVSNYTANVAQQVLPGVRTSVIANGIDAAVFNAAPSQKIATQGPTILSVGEVKARKGTLELLQAIAVVRQSIPDVQCVIIGNVDKASDYVAQVRQEISALGLEGQVHLLDQVGDSTLANWYAAADLFVVPAINVGAKFEGFGLVFLEASAAGLPVVGTSGSGVEDAIDDGVTGLLVPQSTVTADLPNAIITLLTDRARAERMGAAGREWAKNHGWDVAVSKLLTLYEDLLR